MSLRYQENWTNSTQQIINVNYEKFEYNKKVVRNSKSETVNRRRTDNTMVKWKRTKGQTMIY
jgi:hypothetical protein